MNADYTNPPLPSYLFAWSGVSFYVPQAWQLSDYVFSRHTVTVKLEDAYARRLQIGISRILQINVIPTIINM